MSTRCLSSFKTENGFEIRLTNRGIGNRYKNKIIEINEKLATNRDYRPLYDEIIRHEMSHSDSENNLHDLMLDLKGFNNRYLYWKFVVTTSSSWWQFLPLYKSSFGVMHLDINLMRFWAIFIVILFIICIIII